MSDQIYRTQEKPPSRILLGLGWIALVLVAVGILAASWVFGLPDGQDLAKNMALTTAFSAELWQGVLYPRHLPTLWDGLGGLDLYFTGPMPFWLIELVRPACIGCPDAKVLAVFGGVALVLSGLAFYIAARGSVARSAAMTGALIYMILPYHLWIDWIERQAIGEVTAFIFAPLFFLGAIKLLKGGGGTVFAIGLAGMIFSHLPSALLVVHVFAISLVCWILFQVLTGRVIRLAKGLGWTVVFTAVGLALAAVYWLPALGLVGDVASDRLLAGDLQPERWLFLDGTDAPDPDFEAKILMLLGLGGAITLLPLLIGAWRAQIFWLFAFVPVVVVALSMSVLAAPVWTHWIIDWAQFPWRGLMLVDIAAAFAVALAVHYRPFGEWGSLVRLVLVAAVLAGMFLTVPDGVRTVQRGPDAVAGGFAMAGATEYVPQRMATAAGSGDDATVTNAILDISRSSRASPPIIPGTLTHRSYSAEIPEGQTAVILRLPFWPHWQGTDQDGGAITLAPEPQQGLTFASLPPGTTSVQLTLPWHLAEQIGLALSGLGVLCLSVSVLPRRRREPRPQKPVKTPLAGRVEPRI